MKNKKYIIKIENPCIEEWQSMDEEEISRFCNKCQKSVINFADMSDREIYNYLEKSDSKICGRFKNEQLNRPIVNPNYNPNYHERSKYLPILAGMLLMTGNEIANATDSTNTNKATSYITPSSSQDSTKTDIKSDSVDKAINEEKFCYIMGYVKDENNKPILGATIKLLGTTWGAKSDTSGFFKIKIRKTISNFDLELKITSIGLKEEKYEIEKSDFNSNIQIKMKPIDNSELYKVGMISKDPSEISHPNIHIIRPGK